MLALDVARERHTIPLHVVGTRSGQFPHCGQGPLFPGHPLFFPHDSSCARTLRTTMLVCAGPRPTVSLVSSWEVYAFTMVSIAISGTNFQSSSPSCGPLCLARPDHMLLELPALRQLVIRRMSCSCASSTHTSRSPASSSATVQIGSYACTIPVVRSTQISCTTPSALPGGGL